MVFLKGRFCGGCVFFVSGLMVVLVVSSFELLQLRLNECLTKHSKESELLDDLELATTASQAAYGYAMAAGHLDTIEKFIAMHTIHAQ